MPKKGAEARVAARPRNVPYTVYRNVDGFIQQAGTAHPQDLQFLGVDPLVYSVLRVASDPRTQCVDIESKQVVAKPPIDVVVPGEAKPGERVQFKLHEPAHLVVRNGSESLVGEVAQAGVVELRFAEAGDYQVELTPDVRLPHECVVTIGDDAATPDLVGTPDLVLVLQSPRFRLQRILRSIENDPGETIEEVALNLVDLVRALRERGV